MELSITTILSRQLRRTSLLALVLACLLAPPAALARQTPEEKAQAKDEKAAAKEAAEKEKLLQVFVSEPYLELSTGPGAGIPSSEKTRDPCCWIRSREADSCCMEAVS